MGRLSRDRRRTDNGFSLVEVIVALGLMAVVLLALLSTSIFAVQATVDGRRNQQAADYLNRAIESVRSLTYADAVLLDSQVAGDPAVVTVAGVRYFDPGTGLEPLASSATGTVRPQRETVATDNGTYTTNRYVTIPVGTPIVQGVPAVRRVTVVVTWTNRTGTHTRRSSTLMTNTRRGLPLPNFTFKYNGPATVTAGVPHWVKNPENDVSYGMVVNNLGARDGWSLTASTSGWTFYRDTDQDGLWSEDPLTEPPLTGSSTGLIEPGSAPFYAVAYREIGAGESGTSATVFTATSEAITTVSKTVTTRLTVQTAAVVAPVPTSSPAAPTGSCNPATAPSIVSTGTPPSATTQGRYTLKSIFFYTPGQYQDTTAVATNVMGRDTSALTPRQCNWSTDLHTALPGRYLGTTTDPAALARMAQFRFQPSSRAEDEFRGSPVVSLWVQCPSGAPTITVSLISMSGSTATERSAAAMSTSGCTSTSFTRFDVALPDRTFSLGSLSDSLIVRLTSSAPVRLGYGASTTPASLTIGMK